MRACLLADEEARGHGLDEIDAGEVDRHAARLLGGHQRPQDRAHAADRGKIEIAREPQAGNAVVIINDHPEFVVRQGGWARHVIDVPSFSFAYKSLRCTVG